MASIYKRGGKKNRKGPYYVQYFDENGRRRTVKGCTDKEATEALARKLEADAMLRRKGVIDPKADRYSATELKPLKDHLQDYYASLLAKGNTQKYAEMVKVRVENLLKQHKATYLSELTASDVQQAVSGLRGAGLSLQTCNHYLRAIKQFSRWLWRDGRVREDALAHLSGYNVKLDPRHERRALTEEEFSSLVQTAEIGPVVMDMSGPDRAMLYQLTVGTAFRVGELRSLMPESFDLDAEQPTVTVEAGYSKRRRRDVQPIRHDLAQLLRAWLNGREPGKPMFKMPEKLSKMVRADLAAARIPYRDSAGRVADFHALRHTAGTLLKSKGVHPKAIQAFMRHSTVTLTMDRYTHVGIRDQGAVLEALPKAESDNPTRQVAQAKATGTYDLSPSHASGALHYAQQSGGISGHAKTSADMQSKENVRRGKLRKPLPIAALDISEHDQSPPVNNAPGRTRTCDLRFRKPPLYPD